MEKEKTDRHEIEEEMKGLDDRCCLNPADLHREIQHRASPKLQSARRMTPAYGTGLENNFCNEVAGDRSRQSGLVIAYGLIVVCRQEKFTGNYKTENSGCNCGIKAPDARRIVVS